MKLKVFLSCIILGMCLSTGVLAVSYPEITSQAAIVVDRETNEVLYEKNPDERMYPASTTKMMTALIALELGNMEEKVTVTKEQLRVLDNTGSSISLKAGDVLTLEQLIYYLLVASGNDAANVIAEYVGGSIESFVELMNRRAEELGCTGTHFTNAHGLHDDEHYTTARDLYLIAKEAMKNETFRKAVSTQRYVIGPTDACPEERVFYTTNHLISKWRNVNYIYSKAIGIKTGYTSKAGNCLVSGASDGGSTYYCVILGAPEVDGRIMSFVESKELLEWAFANYKVKAIITADEPIKEIEVELSNIYDYVMVVPERSASKLMLKDLTVDMMDKTIDVPEKLQAPIEKGQVVGTMTLSYEGKTYASVNLVSAATIERSELLYLLYIVQTFLAGKAFRIIAGVLVCVLVFAVLFFAVIRRSRRKKRRRYPGRRI